MLGVLDFTVGSMFTWLLDGSKTYTIDTSVAGGTAASSTTPIAIKATGTCRNWTLGSGAVNC
ncbi:hypothetical protein ACGFZL_10980 [Streptomyces sp. NPDC048182]|uniref:hypothetical protein n=1 Tax=Streptomyces sp. NPDC048182 TaxID=3365507 RepID=UPI003723E992